MGVWEAIIDWKNDYYRFFCRNFAVILSEPSKTKDCMKVPSDSGQESNMVQFYNLQAIRLTNRFKVVTCMMVDESLQSYIPHF